MKNALRSLLVVSVSFIAAAAYGAGGGVPGVDIIAKEKAGGKVVYQGKTNATGKFSTSTLAPGSYIVEFRSKEATAFQVALGGAKDAKQTKMSGAGLAYNVEVAPAGKLTGQITALAVQTPVASKSNNPNVRVINGKRYVLVKGDIGSQMGGKWIPEEEATAVDKNAGRDSSQMLRNMQDMGGQGSVPGP